MCSKITNTKLFDKGRKEKSQRVGGCSSKKRRFETRLFKNSFQTEKWKDEKMGAEGVT